MVDFYTAVDTDIAGVYQLKGSNPGGAGEYRGEVAVMQTGDVYQVGWTIAGTQYVGTGVLRGQTLSVIYQLQGQQAGIAVYEVQPNGDLEGVWTLLGGQVLGTETWVPQGRI